MLLLGLFSSCGEWGLFFVAVLRLLTVVASRCRARILECMGFSSCSGGLKSCGFWAIDHRLNTCAAWAQLLLGMWGPPRSEIQPVSPALAGRFFTSEPPGKPLDGLCLCQDVALSSQGDPRVDGSQKPCL